MATFNETIVAIENTFADTTKWSGPTVFPPNFSGILPAEWIRLNIFQGNSTLNYQGNQLRTGFVTCNIYVSIGRGVRRLHQIADEIETLLAKETISGIQFTNSFLSTVGVDPADPSLYRLDYTINFNNYN